MAIIFEVFPNPQTKVIIKTQETSGVPHGGRSVEDFFTDKSLDDSIVGVKCPSITLAFDVLDEDFGFLGSQGLDDLNAKSTILPLFIPPYNPAQDNADTKQQEPYAYIRFTNTNKLGEAERASKLGEEKQDSTYKETKCSDKQGFFHRFRDKCKNFSSHIFKVNA